MVLLDTNFEQWQQAPAEFGAGVEVGQLLTPLTRFRDYDATHYAIDNGAYAGFDAKAFRSLLNRQSTKRARCLFVAVPDVVGSARRTLEVFNFWKSELQGWPRAYVTQNGQEQSPIPWSEIQALFIGGDDRHKDGSEGMAAARAAVAMGKWLHFGRVNGTQRVKKIVEMFGDYKKLSIDGSGISKYSHMRVNFGCAVRDDPIPEPDEHLYLEQSA